MTIAPETRAHAQALLDFIDASPSPWHVVQTTEEHLQAAGYLRLEETERWQLAPGGRYYVVRGGSSIVAFVVVRVVSMCDGTMRVHGGVSTSSTP